MYIQEHGEIVIGLLLIYMLFLFSPESRCST